MSRIPGEISLQIAIQVSKGVWSITEVMEVIKREVDAEEISENVNVKEQRTAAGQRAKPNVQGTVSSFHVKGGKSVKCLLCNDDHFSAECAVVTNLKERKDCLLKSGRCFNCLSTRHIARHCDRKRHCRKCGGSLWSAFSAKHRTRYIQELFHILRAFIFIKGNFNNLWLHLTNIPIAYGFQLLLNLTYFRNLNYFQISTTSKFQQLSNSTTFEFQLLPNFNCKSLLWLLLSDLQRLALLVFQTFRMSYH